MSGNSGVIWWVRRDLRLSDNAALLAACARARETGGGVIPVFVLDGPAEALGAAPRWRLGLGLEALADSLAERGLRLILRRGAPGAQLGRLARETGAGDVVWNRLYDPESRERDTQVKQALRQAGLSARSFAGHLLHEPWSVETGQGGFYRVYSPYWRAVRGLPVPAPEAAPAVIPAPAQWPASDRLAHWRLGAAMNRGAPVVARHCRVGEAAAQGRLEAFIDDRLDDYRARRDFPAEGATSGLSENLTYGEISPRRLWHAGRAAMEEGRPGAEHFLKELVWREFAWHLMYHTPHIAEQNWREGWERFPWRGDNAQAEAWRQGRTGVPLVDAAMREMYVTGTMHNRARMIAASYLSKHLLTDWRVGQAWFAECLVDWDAASNAMGWQWVAGCGPDAAPYFRIFNPETQAAKFDPEGRYIARFVAELSDAPGREALDFFEAAPRSWGLSPEQPYASPAIGLKEGRARALAAHEALRGR
ncbi:cryptochrome/photolyase family protein [Alkalilacustris brevis]|uniref:cryptochrome/photolyase family protein n=1 Tax=Alkalilacustris brevis TaxID=2026338 RepID=UPI000E0D8EBE|nr:deoxyribodipyrimidine photo-lyase [Alkalilacustris brevis]